MATQYYTVPSTDLCCMCDDVPAVTLLYAIDTVQQLYCSPYNPYRSARLIGVAAIEGDLDAVRSWKDMNSPSNLYMDITVEFIEKNMVLLDAKNIRDARREANSYWRKGDSYNRYNESLLFEGTWCKAHKDMPKL